MGFLVLEEVLVDAVGVVPNAEAPVMAEFEVRSGDRYRLGTLARYTSWSGADCAGRLPGLCLFPR